MYFLRGFTFMLWKLFRWSWITDSICNKLFYTQWKWYCYLPYGLYYVKDKDAREKYDICEQRCLQTVPNRCTGGKTYKTVSFGPNNKYVPVKMFCSIHYKLNEIPTDVLQDTPYNSFDRKDEINQKIVLRIKEDVSKMKQRMCLSEHPFGTVKWYHGAHYFLCKGK